MSKPEAERESPNLVLQQPGGEMSVGSDPNAAHAPPPADTLMGLPCAKCGALYPLPRGATTWRCRPCGHFNATHEDRDFIICSIS